MKTAMAAGVAAGMTKDQLLQQIRKDMRKHNCAASLSVDRIFATGIWHQLTVDAQEELGQVGARELANDAEHGTRETIIRQATRGVDGKPVRRYADQAFVGPHGSAKLKSALWSFRYQGKDGWKPLMEFTAEDFAAFRDRSQKEVDGAKKNVAFARFGLSLLSKHGVTRVLDLPAGALTDLETRLIQVKS